MEAIAETAEQGQESNVLTLNDSLPLNPPMAEPQKPLRKYWFSKENAREMSAKAHEAKRTRAERLRQTNEPDRQTDEDYRLASLARTRGLIARLESELEKCTNPQAINYLSGSIAKMRDAEQKLAGRPLPGSHRPTRNPKSSAPSQSSFQPTE